MITEIVNRCIYVYGSNPSATVTVVSSGGNISPTMTDTRKQAGAYDESFGDGDNTHGDAGDFPSTSASSVKTGATFDKISQSNASVSTPTDTNNKLYPIYYDGSGSIQAMTATDVFDTFINTAINTLVDGNDRAGTFRIHTATSLSGHTLISSTPVFTDTRANTGAYSAGSIPETRDQPFDVNNYYFAFDHLIAGSAFQILKRDHHMLPVSRPLLQAFIPGLNARHGRPFEVHAEKPVEIGPGRNIRQTELCAAKKVPATSLFP